MTNRDLQIGLFGTFDVENYGDLLFPLIAEVELTKRLGRINLHRFSYHARTPPAWPYTVTSLTELPRTARDLDGILIGGGFVIRFDKYVATGYGPPSPEIHHPTGYWLTPALIALQYGIPLIWNAPGMHINEIPAWADPMMKLVLRRSQYVAVRDEPTKTALARFADKETISVVPDTAFGLSRLLDEQHPSQEFNSLRESLGLSDPYIVVQPLPGLDNFLNLVTKHPERLRGLRFLVLPIGPVLGDHETVLGNDLPGFVRVPAWPHPLLLTELIRNAAAVVGHSYHLAICALSFGVPVFCSADLRIGKYTILMNFDTVYSLSNESELDPDWFLNRVGKTAPTALARAACAQLSVHWDRVAAAIDNKRTGAESSVSRFLQSLPTLLESASNRHDADTSEVAALNQRIAKLLESASNRHDADTSEIAALNQRIAKLLTSPSWRITAPCRFVMRNLKRLVGR